MPLNHLHRVDARRETIERFGLGHGVRSFQPFMYLVDGTAVHISAGGRTNLDRRRVVVDELNGLVVAHGRQ